MTATMTSPTPTEVVGAIRVPDAGTARITLIDQAQTALEHAGKSGMEAIEPLAKLFEARIWEEFEVSWWGEFFEAYMPLPHVPVTRKDRPEAVKALRLVGMGQADIAETLGVGQSTIQRDLTQMGNVEFPPIVARDGKDYGNGTGRPSVKEVLRQAREEDKRERAEEEEEMRKANEEHERTRPETEEDLKWGRLVEVSDRFLNTGIESRLQTGAIAADVKILEGIIREIEEFIETLREEKLA